MNRGVVFDVHCMTGDIILEGVNRHRVTDGSVFE